MASFSSRGLDLAYDDIAASGERRGTVVLVHGFASNRAENWKRLGWYAALQRGGYRVVALDLRGHGESAKPHEAEAYQRAELAADVLALMDEANLGRAHLMGYSMGAHLALAIALKAPERVDRLVLGGIGGRVLGEGPPRPTPAMSLSEALLAEDPAAIKDPIQRGFRQFAQIQGDDRQALAACSKGRGEAVTRQDLDGLSAPTLVVAGAGDDLAGDPQTLADAIPGAKAVVLPGCDHFSAIPHALFKSAVFDFLEGWDDAEEAWPEL
ncbi:MAG TPA: alpha/beta fold hydrolase [Caulobacteraceae bacterium]|jgi:pimeloyl-ACP methyl ester carboxylesterase